MTKKRDRRQKYNWTGLKVDQSLKYIGKTRTGPYVLASRASVRHAPMRFEGGWDTKGIGRVWRVK